MTISLFYTILALYGQGQMFFDVFRLSFVPFAAEMSLLSF